MDSTRSPMDNLYKMLSGFSASNDKALKQGIYNAMALSLLCIVLAAGYGLYIVLSPFIKPLVWALLCGSVLFPFKCSLATAVQSWFDKVELSNKPLVINLSLIPLQIIDTSSERIGSFLWKHVKYIAMIISTGTIGLALFYYTPTLLTCLTWRIFNIFAIILGFFISTCNALMIATICIGYVSVLYIHWTPENSHRFRYASFVLWFIISLYLSNILGVYQIVVFMSLQILYLLGFSYEVALIMESQEAQGNQTTFTEAARFALTNGIIPEVTECKIAEQEDKCDINQSSEKKVDSAESVIEVRTKVTSDDIKKSASAIKLDKKSMSLDTEVDPSVTSTINKSKYIRGVPLAAPRNRYVLRRLKTELRLSLDTEDNKVDSDIYMYAVLYACVGMLLWKHRWIVHILVIPIAYYIVKKTGNYFGFWEMIYRQYKYVVNIITDWCSERHEALLPSSVRGLYKVGILIDEKLTQGLKSSVDAVATTAVILGLLIFTVCTSIFITVQIYTEGIHMIQVTGEILNSSLNNPDIDWVPGQWEESVNSVLDNAYTYGRSAISDGVKSLVKNLEPSKAEQTEKKVLELWDRLYQTWMMSSERPDLIGPTVDITAVYSVWENFKDTFGKMPLQLFDMTNLQNFAKENVGILTSVLDSVWSIVKGNVSIIITVFTELLDIVLMSGSAVLNFSLSMVVFFTTLFYLLSASGQTYKPVELTTMLSPISCHRFATALQESVIGVFAATFKIASFFGMWTWFIHNLFQVKIVYLPAALATILGAVPFLDAYFACIPATVELWFTRGSIIAIPFFLFHFLPYNIVITEFYKEIKGGGHPYLTGLSIAGGIFCLGVEGAIFGPLLLCCIMVVINLSRRYLQSPSEEIMSQYSHMRQ